MIENANSKVVSPASAATMNATGDKFTFTPAKPVDVVRWGLIATVAMTGSAVVALDHRPTAGSDTGRVDGAVDANGVDTAGGTITAGAVAQGKGVYHNLSSPLRVDVGEEVVVQVTTAAGAGSAVPFVEYIERPFVGDANSGDSRIANMTKKAS